MKSKSLSRLMAALSAALLLALTTAPVHAGDGTSPVGRPGGPTSSSGSDDVEGIPLVAQEPSTGFELEIEAWRLEQLLSGVRGKGRVELRPTRPGRVAVRFTGSFEIQVPTTYLRSRSLHVRYHGARNDMRVLQSGGRVVLLQR